MLSKKKSIQVAVAVTTAAALFYGGMLAASVWRPVVVRHELSAVEQKERSLPSEADMEDVLLILDLSYEKAAFHNERVYGFWEELLDLGLSSSREFVPGVEHSHALRGFMRDLDSNRLMLHYDLLSGYVVMPDLPYYRQAYEHLLTEDAKEYLDFRIMEIEQHLFNPNINTVDMERIVQRAEWLESRIESNRHGMFAEVYRELLGYYYDALEGRTHDFFVDADTYELTSYAEVAYALYADRDDRIGDIARKVLEEGPWQQEFSVLGQGSFDAEMDFVQEGIAFDFNGE